MVSKISHIRTYIHTYVVYMHILHIYTLCNKSSSQLRGFAWE